MPLYVQGPCREYRWGKSVCNLQPMFYHLFLKMGLTWARHLSAQSLPVWMERSNMTWIIGAISSHNSFNKMGLSLSRLASFPGFRFFNSFSMPATEMLKSSMTGVDFCISGGSNSRGILPLLAASWRFILHGWERDSGSLVVKTLEV